MSPFNHETAIEAGKKGGKIGGKAGGFCKVRGDSNHYHRMIAERWKKEKSPTESTPAAIPGKKINPVLAAFYKRQGDAKQQK